MTRKKFNRIKEVIKKHKSTGADLARWMGRPAPRISLWVTNKVQPSIPDLYLIAEYFNINVTELLYATPDKNNAQTK